MQVERSGLRGSEPYYHRVYYLSSCQADASVFREGIQGHWGIENQLHWPKDVILQEDLSTVHQFQAATNFSVLKTLPP